MKRYALLCTVVGLFVLAEGAQAHWGTVHYGGYQPWWNVFAKRGRCLTLEEERLQQFWHDYYDALRNYYDCLDNVDWVAYYKNHGYQINVSGPGPNGGCQRTMFAPVFVAPNMQWALPNACLNNQAVMPPPGAFPHGGHPHPGAQPPPGFPGPGAFQPGAPMPMPTPMPPAGGAAN